MAPQSEVITPGGLKVTLQYLDRCADICLRLATWKKEIFGTEGPVTVLVGNHIGILVAETINLRSELLNLGNKNIPRDGYILSEKLASALKSTKIRLFEMLELLDFYEREERHGHDGALNALFASAAILNPVKHHETSAIHNEDKLLRLGFEIRDIVTEAISRTEPNNTAASVFHYLEPMITSTFSLLTEQFRPRYVQSYKSMSDTPYVHDASTSVFRGSYGTVQMVNHKRNGETLAMKTFREVYSDKAKRQILREVGVLEVCYHKNIVRLVEALKTEDDEHSICIVMRPWAPYTLANFLYSPNAVRKKRCPWFDPGCPRSASCIYRMMYELADAVAYLHCRSIKHKDLKPDNILLFQEECESVTPLITDVGVSKVYIFGAATNHTDSTYEYLAPEQHAKKASTLASDIWQLGCCFAELHALGVGGTLAYERLHASFSRDQEDCSCSIALEHSHFMKAFFEICGRGSAAQIKVYGIISAMLDLELSTRLDVQMVKAALSKLPGVRCTAMA